jgi:hypothetical protein
MFDPRLIRQGVTILVEERIVGMRVKVRILGGGGVNSMEGNVERQGTALM